MRQAAEVIIRESIYQVLPDAAVKKALEKKTFPGKVILVAAGKAAWQMANAAHEVLGKRIADGIVITKYDLPTQLQAIIISFEIICLKFSLSDRQCNCQLR